MAIIYHEMSREFHLQNEEISYVIRILPNEQLENLYYGAKVPDRESFVYLHEEEMRSLMSVQTPEPSLLSLDYTRQEYPSYGTGDYRYPAFMIQQENGSHISDFQYQEYEIFAGKKKLEGLPAVYVNEEKEAESLEITLYDEVSETKLILTYTIFEHLPVLIRSAKFVQEGRQVVYLDRAMSASVDLPDMDYEMIHLSGAWGRERYVKTKKLDRCNQSIYSLRGASSSEANPFMALKRPDANEKSGEVYGVSLLYSGNFLAQADVNSFDTTRISIGIHPEQFCWKLEPGESFQTPEAVFVYSDQGINKMSQTFHKLYRNNLIRGIWKTKEKPILLNNWEATEMDFDEEKILKIAKKGKEAGVELFVLDDGWFGNRDNDLDGLGDWFVNTKKLPDGIKGLSEKVEALGLKFGLWIEPEMINKGTKLYKEHPNYLIQTPGRFQSHGRHQFVLDFSRKEVVDAVHTQIQKVLQESKISYVKWDMNRYMTETFSLGLPADRQGEMMHRYILGVYDLYERFTSEFPEILFESCASGGARFDPGMLYYAPQTWCSDDTDAGERMKIQYGTSYVYPISSMGSHVSAVPNSQMNRNTPIETRANVAYFGTFGYELDLNELPKEEFEKVKEQVKIMKQYRNLIHTGTFYRLVNPFEKQDAAWGVVSEDKAEALFGYYQTLGKTNAGGLRLKLDGLKEEAIYWVKTEGTSQTYTGAELMRIGFVINRQWLWKKGGDFASILIHVKEQ